MGDGPMKIRVFAHIVNQDPETGTTQLRPISSEPAEEPDASDQSEQERPNGVPLHDLAVGAEIAITMEVIAQLEHGLLLRLHENNEPSSSSAHSARRVERGNRGQCRIARPSRSAAASPSTDSEPAWSARVSTPLPTARKCCVCPP